VIPPCEILVGDAGCAIVGQYFTVGLASVWWSEVIGNQTTKV
jgi:hypothetical protein